MQILSISTTKEQISDIDFWRRQQSATAGFVSRSAVVRLAIGQWISAQEQEKRQQLAQRYQQEGGDGQKKTSDSLQ